MRQNGKKVSIWSIIMIILIAMVSGASAVTDSDLDSNGSVVLSDIQGETVGTKVEALVTTPPFTRMISSDISVVGLDSVSLHQNAVNLATKLVGTSYLWGGKGFDYQTMKFADAETIASGYTYYDPLTGTNKIGKGVDCSGLVFWSFNKAYGATKYKDTSNPVYYEGAAGQWSDSSRFRQKSTSVPSKDNLAVGDLLFIGTVNTKSPDHVGIYMGNGNVIHAKGSATIEIKTLDGWLNLPVDSTRKYRDCFTGYGSVVTSEPPESATFSTGDSVEVQNTNPLGLKVRDSPAGNKTGNVCDGTRGTILDGPQSAFLEELTYTWWKVRWDDGQVGWSTERHPVSGGVYYFKKVIPTTGSISITTTPTGASVYLDGVYKGITPFTLHSVSAGTHTVKLTLSGYEDYEESVRVYAGQTASITTTMQSIPTTGSISITTTPTGASVYLDGVYKGITPFTLHSVSAGTHTVKLTLSGYEDYEESVRVYAGQTASITTTMQSIPTTGSISITTTPTGASVYLDGVYKGITPFTLHSVSAGTHTVKLTLSGYEDYEESVRVYAGQTASITTTMQSIPTTGSISITTTPTGASVYLDGVYKGITPFTLHSVSAGTHTVKLTLSGYEDYEESVRVYAGQTASITTTMQSIPTTGSISITTTPTGASVYLDGVYKGITPFTLHSVSAGTHTVKLTLSGYEDYEESVRVYAGQTASITTTMQSLPTTGSIFIQPQSSTLAVGQTQAFTIMLDAAPDGLSGFNMTISLIDPPAYWRPSPDPDPSAYWRPSPPPDPRDDGPTSTGSPVGELIGVTYPQWAKLPINSSFPSDSVFIQAVDIDRSVEPGETNVPLFTIIVRGNAPGTALLRVNVTKIEDDIGGRFVPAATDATLIVHNILPFPNPVGGTFPAPTDLDGDGLYEDLDGNGFVGFNDVVIYYQNMDFIERNQPLAAFDYDGSGFIGFNDVVWLYQRV